MRKGRFAGYEYYHIYNRGIEKKSLFLDNEDRLRFLTLLLLFQGDVLFPQISRIIPTVKHLMFDRKPLDREIVNTVLGSRIVELVCFTFMPNHFHLILKPLDEGHIPKFMQRLGNAYAKYFNKRYQRKGHLFESTYSSIHIDNNEYLNHLSAYIHLNIGKMKYWRGKEEKYPWSSFQDYITENRFGKFLAPRIVLDQFSHGKEYLHFVKSGDYSCQTLDV